MPDTVNHQPAVTDFDRLGSPGTRLRAFISAPKHLSDLSFGGRVLGGSRGVCGEGHPLHGPFNGNSIRLWEAGAAVASEVFKN